MLRQIALLGDIHAEDQTLAIILDWLQHKAPDAILCVGDVVDGAGDAARCVQLLRDHRVPTVRGNHDIWCLKHFGRDLNDATEPGVFNADQRQWLEALPAVREFETEAGPLLLCHGVGPDDMQRLLPHDEGYALDVNQPLHTLLKENRFRLMVGGHTHRRMVRRFGALTVINPGTLKRDHEPCFAMLDCSQREVAFFDIDAQRRILAAECVPMH